MVVGIRRGRKEGPVSQPQVLPYPSTRVLWRVGRGWSETSIQVAHTLKGILALGDQVTHNPLKLFGLFQLSGKAIDEEATALWIRQQVVTDHVQNETLGRKGHGFRKTPPCRAVVAHTRL